ncbi:hypothetical protein phytr_5380 [Candidatus Phycorickettsia trachydisci]|uniref:Uncharacterized protein n=1 Tax=Candidatus Phycorickettsia trachydisci TaxID=2115978 RepID=A0A2P1P889_9RICK|nr:hypothetical protein [Candidatus Phycorickettsia trachydisci]AVP87483.1 hypothetical protein phytr_5380 [Candidatus Phycorickettsia trachydisci]
MSDEVIQNNSELDGLEALHIFLQVYREMEQKRYAEFQKKQGVSFCVVGASVSLFMISIMIPNPVYAIVCLSASCLGWSAFFADLVGLVDIVNAYDFVCAKTSWVINKIKGVHDTEKSKADLDESKIGEKPNDETSSIELVIDERPNDEDALQSSASLLGSEQIKTHLI